MKGKAKLEIRLTQDWEKINPTNVNCHQEDFN
jgi:hypothetical protein